MFEHAKFINNLNLIVKMQFYFFNFHLTKYQTRKMD